MFVRMPTSDLHVGGYHHPTEFYDSLSLTVSPGLLVSTVELSMTLILLPAAHAM